VGGDGTHAEVLDVREDLVVQSKVVAGDDVDTGILLDLPVGETESLGLLEELGLRDLAAPVWESSVWGTREMDG
jgi:hypothetical protein